MTRSGTRYSIMLFFVALATNGWADETNSHRSTATVYDMVTPFLQGTTYVAALDFEQGWTTQSNPNGVWSYGYSSGFSKRITLYDQTAQPGIDEPNAQFWVSSSVNIGESPSVEFNNGPFYDDGIVDFGQDEFMLVAGSGGQYSDLVFTAPTDGAYQVWAGFRGDQYKIGAVVGVVVRGKLLFNSTVTAVGQGPQFNAIVRLKAGNKVVISVGPGGVGGPQRVGVDAGIINMIKQ